MLHLQEAAYNIYKRNNATYRQRVRQQAQRYRTNVM
jgi:hypothetical protein